MEALPSDGFGLTTGPSLRPTLQLIPHPIEALPGAVEEYPEAEVSAQKLKDKRIHLANALGLDEEETAHTPPAVSQHKHLVGHYPHKWETDSCSAIEITVRGARNSSNPRPWLQAAEREMFALFDGQDPDTGMVPNAQFVSKGRKLDLERILAFGGRSAKASIYTQPFFPPQAALETFAAMETVDQRWAYQFLAKIYPKLDNLAGYWYQRSIGPLYPLVDVSHGHVTTRDSDPTLNVEKRFLIPRKGANTPRIVDAINAPIDFANSLHHSVKLKRAGNDLAKQRAAYSIYDVWTNAIYCKNLYIMADLATTLGKVEDATNYAQLAKAVEEKMFSKMWFPKDRERKGAFRSLDRYGRPIPEVSISNVTSLILPNAEDKMVVSNLDMLDDEFDLPYVLSTVGKNSRNFDPHSHMFDRLWTGHIMVLGSKVVQDTGLKYQITRPEFTDHDQIQERSRRWIGRIATKTYEMVVQKNSRTHETYDPITGKGLRPRVGEFTWSEYARTM